MGGTTSDGITPDGEPLGIFYEMDPVAREAAVLPIAPELRARLPAGDLELRLRMTRGAWKLDQVALVTLGPSVEPEAHELAEVRRQGHPDPEALASLKDAERHLVTYPEDAYELIFGEVPADREVFLESRGYYYEWMREQWLAEENPQAILDFIADPAATLRRLAPAYAALEPDIERIFWQSRIGAER